MAAFMSHSRAMQWAHNNKSEVTSVLPEPMCCTMLCTLHIHMLQGSHGGLQATLPSTTQMPAVSTNSKRLTVQERSQSWDSRPAK